MSVTVASNTAKEPDDVDGDTNGTDEGETSPVASAAAAKQPNGDQSSKVQPPASPTGQRFPDIPEIKIDEATHVRAPAIKDDMRKKIDKLRAEVEKSDVYQKNRLLHAYCTERTLHRYLRARPKSVDAAKKMLLNSLKWRSVMNPDQITSKEMENEGKTGKIYISGYDHFGRPVMIMDSSVQNTDSQKEQLRYLTFNLEKVDRMMKNGVEKYVLFIHLELFEWRSSPPIKTSLETVRILLDRYPEFLGHCVVFKPPKIFSKLWSLCQPLVDQHTRSKMIFLTGDTSVGSKNDKILTEVMGPKWRELSGVDQPVLVKGCAAAFDPVSYWKRMAAEDAERKGKPAAAAAASTNANGVADATQNKALPTSTNASAVSASAATAPTTTSATTTAAKR